MRLTNLVRTVFANQNKPSTKVSPVSPVSAGIMAAAASDFLTYSVLS